MHVRIITVPCADFAAEPGAFSGSPLFAVKSQTPSLPRRARSRHAIQTAVVIPFDFKRYHYRLRNILLANVHFAQDPLDDPFPALLTLDELLAEALGQLVARVSHLCDQLARKALGL